MVSNRELLIGVLAVIDDMKDKFPDRVIMAMDSGLAFNIWQFRNSEAQNLTLLRAFNAQGLGIYNLDQRILSELRLHPQRKELNDLVLDVCLKGQAPKALWAWEEFNLWCGTHKDDTYEHHVPSEYYLI